MFSGFGIELLLPDLNRPSFARLSPLAILHELDSLLGRDLSGPRVRLIGSSLGGFLASLFAAEHPTLVDRMVLIAPAFDFGQRWRERLGETGIERWLAELCSKLGVARDQVVLGGFSQGAMLSVDVALNDQKGQGAEQKGLAGLALLSGALLTAIAAGLFLWRLRDWRQARQMLAAWRQAHTAARTDVLTGLGNRRGVHRPQCQPRNTHVPPDHRPGPHRPPFDRGNQLHHARRECCTTVQHRGRRDDSAQGIGRRVQHLRRNSGAKGEDPAGRCRVLPPGTRPVSLSRSAAAIAATIGPQQHGASVGDNIDI